MDQIHNTPSISKWTLHAGILVAAAVAVFILFDYLGYSHAGFAIGAGLVLCAAILVKAPERSWLLQVALALTLITPNLSVLPGFALIRLDQILWGLVLVFLLWQGSERTLWWRKPLRPFILVSLAFVAVIVLSMVWGKLNDKSIAVRQLTQLIWPVSYIVVLVGSFWTASASRDRIVHVFSWLFAGGAVAALVSILQIYNIFQFNKYVSPLFLGSDDRMRHLEAMVKTNRVYGTAGNAGLYGVLMGIVLIAALALWLKSRAHRWQSLALLTLSTTALITSLSRTALVATAAAGLYVGLMTLGLPHRWRLPEVCRALAGLAAILVGFGLAAGIFLTQPAVVRNGFLHRITNVFTAQVTVVKPVPAPPPTTTGQTGQAAANGTSNGANGEPGAPIDQNPSVQPGTTTNNGAKGKPSESGSAGESTTPPPPQVERTRMSRLVRDFQVRFSRWTAHLGGGIRLIGYGAPPVSEASGPVDGEYINILGRYGVVGLLVYFSLFGVLFWRVRRVRRAAVAGEEVAMCLAAEAAVMIGLLYGSLAATYYSTQVMGLIISLAGAALAYAQPEGVERARNT